MSSLPALPNGRIVSVRAGRARTMPRPDWDKSANRTWTSAYMKEELTGPVEVKSLGLEGDEQHDRRAHGGPHMAVLMYAAAHYPRWREELGIPEMGPGGFAENLTVDGLEERSVCIGDVLEGGSVRLQISQPRGPCANIARRWSRQELLGIVRGNGRTGWYLRVLREGSLISGDVLRVIERPHPEWSVARVLTLRLDGAGDPEAISFLARCPELSPGWRDKFEKLEAKSAGR